MNFNELFLDFTKMILVTGRIFPSSKVSILQPAIFLSVKYFSREFSGHDSDGYNKNGFNLASLIDEVYSYNRQDSHFITYSGSLLLLQLSFQYIWINIFF